MAKYIKKDTDATFSNTEKESLIEDLKHFGYLLPTSDSELKQFEKEFSSEEAITMPDRFIDGSFLLKITKEKDNDRQSNQIIPLERKPVGKSKSKGHDYFKKVVLAAEIAYQLHEEPTFGHKKFVKIQYLCEQVCVMNLKTNYGRYAAGPLDPKLMYSIDSEFKKQKWFNAIKRESFGYKYELLENVERYKTYFSNYFGNQQTEISTIIELFRKEKSDFCEIVATLFYIWKDCLQKLRIINNPALIQEFYAWDESKKRFKETDINTAIAWMNEKGIIPQKALL
jgi:hypothetical protein